MSEPETDSVGNAGDAEALSAAVDARIADLQQVQAKLGGENQKQVFDDIAKVLQSVLAKPFVASDVHFQAVLARMTRASSMEQLTQCVAELDLHAKRLVASTLGEPLPIGSAVGSSNATANQSQQTPAHLADTKAKRPVRMRLQVR